jgi:transitional endoplasmic reticulum ATPase
MSDEIIKNLLDALQVSPTNVPLRLQVATMLAEKKDYEGAAEQYNEVLRLSYGNMQAQAGLARCYFHTGKYSADNYL